MSKSKIKVMLITFFCQKRTGQSRVCAGRVNSESTLLQRSPWMSSRPGATQQAQLVGEPFMSTPSQQRTCTHCSQCEAVLGQKKVTCLEHPPYSPYLAPCDSWLFPRMKSTHFASVEEIKAAVTRQLRALKEKDFTECFQGWQKRTNKCIDSEGEYFEGDNYLFVSKFANKCLILKVSFLFCHTSYIYTKGCQEIITNLSRNRNLYM